MMVEQRGEAIDAEQRLKEEATSVRLDRRREAEERQWLEGAVYLLSDRNESLSRRFSSLRLACVVATFAALSVFAYFLFVAPREDAGIGGLCSFVVSLYLIIALYFTRKGDG